MTHETSAVNVKCFRCGGEILSVSYVMGDFRFCVICYNHILHYPQFEKEDELCSANPTEPELGN